VTLRLMFAPDPAAFKARRDLDLWITMEGGAQWPNPDPSIVGAQAPNFPELYASGMYIGKETFNHGRATRLANMRAIVDHGAKVNVCPRIDSQFAGGGSSIGIPAYQDLGQSGVAPGL
jgi:hypothetical protein